MARQWEEALLRQAELQRFQEEHFGSRPGRVELELAAKQELAEFGAAVKGMWAWWRRRDRRFLVEREAALEELADALHFVLAGLLLEEEARRRVAGRPVNLERPNARAAPLVGTLVRLYREPRFEGLFLGLLELAAALGFSEEDLLRAYLEKSGVNLERWRGA